MTTADNPLRWLLDALPGYVEPEALAVLMERFDANKQAYERAIKIHHAERVITTFERRNYPPDAKRLAHWKARLAALLKEEQP